MCQLMLKAILTASSALQPVRPTSALAGAARTAIAAPRAAALPRPTTATTATATRILERKLAVLLKLVSSSRAFLLGYVIDALKPGPGTSRDMTGTKAFPRLETIVVSWVG